MSISEVNSLWNSCSAMNSFLDVLRCPTFTPGIANEARKHAAHGAKHDKQNKSAPIYGCASIKNRASHRVSLPSN